MRIGESMAFKMDTEECDDRVEGDVGENITEFITLLAKSFNKVIIRHYRRFMSNISINVKDISNKTPKVPTFSVKEKMEKTKQWQENPVS